MSARRHGGPMGGMRHGMLPGEKAKNFMPTLKRLLSYFAPRKALFAAVFLLAAASTVFSILGPRIFGQATNMLSEGVTRVAAGAPPAAAFDMAGIARILLTMAALYALSSVLSFAMQYIMAGVAQKTACDMRGQIKQKLDRLPLKYFDTNSHGDILSRVTNDMDTIANTLQQSLAQTITAAITVGGTVFMMLSINTTLSLISFVILPVSMTVMSLIMKNSQKYFKGQQKTLGRLNGHIEEMFTGHKAVMAYGMEQQSIADFHEMNEALCKVGGMAQFVSGLVHPVINFINKLGYVGVCVAGGVLVVRGQTTIGGVQAFLQYLNNFGQPLGQIASIANVFQSAVAAAERVFEVLDETEQVPDRFENAGDITSGQVVFENVAFRYVPEKPLITGLNLHAAAGHTIAIVGPTGAGKTTLVNLLMRFYELDAGTITIDGIDTTTIPRGQLRRSLGMVLQNTWLFSGTIYDNIAYGREGASDEQVLAASRNALADRFIRTLPQGYDTVLNEDASNISQGQRQLLTIARAILADPRILILDEATSNVDTRTEVLIQEAMSRLMAGRTSFVIAHRLSTIRNADNILVMSGGKIVEQGSHETLLAQGGVYAEIYNSQFAGDS